MNRSFYWAIVPILPYTMLAYMTGNTISVSTVATSKPPLKAMASGLQNTDPIRGIMPKNRCDSSEHDRTETKCSGVDNRFKWFLSFCFVDFNLV